MKDFIKQQQERARGFYADELCCLSPDCEKQRQTVGAYNDLITQIITNTGEELMRLAEGERKEYSVNNFVSGDAVVASHNKAIDTLKKHITSLTGVE